MDVSCLLCAFLFFTGNLILLIVYGKEFGRGHFNLEKYKTLDPDYLQEEWAFRRDHRAPYLTAGIINGLAWFFFAFPMIQLVWILSHRGTRSLGLHITIGILILSGSLTEWIARFLYIGSSMATQYLADEFNLESWISSNSNDGLGWRVLEVAHIVTTGFIFFVDAFEWLVLFGCLTLIFFSVRSWRATTDASTFNGCWNGLGLFVALLSLLDFIAEILRFDGFRTFGPIAFWYATVNRLFLLPLWLILLSRILPFAAMRMNSLQVQQKQQQAEAAAAAAADGHFEMGPTTATTTLSEPPIGGAGANGAGAPSAEPPTFTIDDQQDN